MSEIEIVQHPQIDGLHIFFDTVDYRTPHFHEEFELIWIMEGRLAVKAGQSRFEADPGEMVLFDPQQTHEFHKVQELCTFLCIQISPDLMEGVFPAIRSVRSTGCVRIENYFSNRDYSVLQRQLLEMIRQYFERPQYYELYCAGQTCLLMYRLFSKIQYHLLTSEEAADQERRNARLIRMIRFVDKNYMHRLRLADFAEEEKRSMSYLSHFIKDALGQSFQEYVSTVRFHCACKLIASGQSKMIDVCMASGFSDYRYFSEAFRKRVGMTPEEYSRLPHSPIIDETKVHHSLHSLERFYSWEKSMELLKKYEAEYR